jgi:Permuted papain-like amidase enzyme, YaeF/YiiX, C92 family
MDEGMKIIPSNPVGRVRLLAMLFVFALVAFVYRDQSWFLLTRTPVVYYYFRYSPQEGDVVFQSLPHGDLVDAIEGITHSPFSHCGVVLRNDAGHWVVIESIYNVHETPLFLWLMRGRGGDFAAYRFDAKYSSLIPEFKKDLLFYSGQPYDYDYDMAKGQGVYCSSLVYLAFDKAAGEKMGTLQKLGDLDWKPFEHFIQAEAQGKLPLDRAMITPASLAKAPQLHEVYRTGFY